MWIKWILLGNSIVQDVQLQIGTIRFCKVNIWILILVFVLGEEPLFLFAAYNRKMTAKESLTHRCGTSVERLTCLGANRWSCCRQEIASALTCESGWSCITAQQTRHDNRAVAMEPWLPRSNTTWFDSKLLPQS